MYRITALSAAAFLLLVGFSSFCVRAAAGESIPQIGHFEAEVPIHGTYLQTVNCYTLQWKDEDEDGIADKGYSFDVDRDGTPEVNRLKDPLIVDLKANGFYPGDRIMISTKTSIYDQNMVFWGFHLYGLFSSTAEVLTQEWVYVREGVDWPMVGPVNRVPGAIDAALGGYVHTNRDNSNKWKQGDEVENDIPEDFRIQYSGGFMNSHHGGPWSPDAYRFQNGFWMTIPPGANYLLFQYGQRWILGDYGTGYVTIDKDSDGDAIPDYWEEYGIDFNKDGLLDYVLEDANYLHKDLYVEIDYMGPSGTCPGHRPNPDALNDVILAFSEAPAESVNNPDGSKGITLHIDTDGWDQVIHRDIFEAWSDFHEIKKTSFGTTSERNDPNSEWVLLSKKWTHRYCMFIHQYSTQEEGQLTPTTSAGLAEIGGNDLIVALGGWSTNPGNRDEQAATFMHELGHTLGLLHGGGDDINYKPNYLSIMNYLFSYDWNVGTRPLDYSRKELDPLDEDALDELKGLGVNQIETYSTPWYQTAYSLEKPMQTPRFQLIVTLLMPIDWNSDGSIEPYTHAQINKFPQWGYESPYPETLNGWDDWASLQFYFQEGGLFKQGAEPVRIEDEITWELRQQIQEAIEQNVPYPAPETGLPIAIAAIVMTVITSIAPRKSR